MIRVARKLARGLGWLLLGLVAVVGSVLVHLTASPLGDESAPEILAFVEDALPGAIDAEGLRIDGVTIAGDALAIRTPGGEVVASSGAFVARLAPMSLLAGELRIAEVRAHDLWLDLSGGVDPLLSAFDDGTSEPSEGGSFPVVLDAIALRDARIELGEYEVRSLDADASLRTAPLAIDARLPRAVLQRQGGEVTRLDGARASVDERDDGLHARGQASLRPRGGGGVRASADVALEPLSGRVSLDARGIEAPLFEALGVELPLTSEAYPLGASLDANGSLDAANLAALVWTPHGAVDVAAASDETTARAQVSTTGVDLRTLLGEDLEPVAGAVRAELEVPTGSGAVRLAGRYGDEPVPRVRLGLRLDDDALLLHSLSLQDLPEWTATLGARVGFDERYRWKLALHAPSLFDVRALPVRGEVRIATFGELDGEELRAELRASPSGLDGFGLHLAAANVRAKAQGPLRALDGDAHVRARGLRYGGERVERAAIDARASGSIVEAKLDLSRPKLAFDLDARVRRPTTAWSGAYDGRASATLRVEGRRTEIRLGGRYVAGDAMRADVRSFSARGAHARLDAAGSVRGERFVANVDVEEIDLAPFGDLLQLPLEGRVQETYLDLEGRFDDPRGTARGQVEGVRVDPAMPYVSAGWDARLDGETVVLRAHADSGRGDLGLVARIRRGRGALVRSIERGRIDLHAHAHELDLALVRELADAPVRGVLDVDLTVDGPARDPEASLIVGLARTSVQVEDRWSEPLAGRVAVDAKEGTVHVDADLRDARGRLVEAEGRVVLGDGTLPALLADLPPLTRVPWKVEARIPERSFTELPITLAELPRGRASVHVAVDALEREPQGNVQATLRLDPHALDASCEETRTRLALHGELSSGGAELEGDLALDDEEVATLLVESQDIGRAFAGLLEGRDVGPPDDLRGRLEASPIPLSRIPYACGEVAGHVEGHLELTAMGSARPRGDVELRASLRPDDERYDLVVTADVDSGRARAEVNVNHATRQVMHALAEAPLRWRDQWVPEWSGETLRGDATLDEVPAALFAAVAPVIERGEGTLSGELHASGTTLDDLDARGRLVLDAVGVSVVPTSQRFEDVNGVVRLTPGRLTIEDLRTRDLDGSARLDGHLDLDGWSPRHAELTVNADDFPIRWQGLEQGRLSGVVDVAGTVDDEGSNIEVSLRELEVRLGESLGDTVQDLDPHPRVFYSTDEGYAIDDPEEALAQRLGDTAPAPSSLLPLRLEVRSEESFWVRRSDLAAQVEVAVDATATAEGLRLRGPIRVRRGFLLLVGKSFDLEPGELRFTGGSTLDPQLDLRAMHQVGGGDTVTVDVSGRASSPELAFSSSVPGVETDREVIALLARGRQTEADAAAQTTAFVSALTGGLLARLTRQRAGAYVPVLTVGSAGGQTTLRAGFSVDSLIPDALDDVVQGAYVEGFVGAGGTEQRTTGGVLVELLFPRAITATGRVAEPSGWSADVSWEP